MAHGARRPTLSSGRRRAALLALAVGGFGLGLTEFIPIGLLPEIARGLHPLLSARSPSAAVAGTGWVITAYSLGVVVGAPVIASTTARVGRHRLVAGLLGALVIGSLVSAVAPTFEWELVARFAAGLPHGAYFGAAGLLAERLLGPGQRAKGYAVVLSGLTAANVFGVPLVTRLGQATSWRLAYLAVAAVFAVSLAAVLATVPATPAEHGSSARAELAAFRSPRVWLVALTVAVGTAGFYGVYTYISPVVTGVTRLGASAVPWALAATGAGMTVGVIIGGRLADRDLRRTLVTGMVALVAAEAAFSVLSANAVGLFATAFLVGAASMAIAPAMQSRLIGAVPGAQLMGAAVNQSATNIANSLGAAMGSLVVGAGLGYRSPAAFAVLLGLAGLALTVVSFRSESRGLRQECVGAPVPT